MTATSLLSRLQSADHDIVADALEELGAERLEAPLDAELSAAVRHLGSSDPELSGAAVFALATHWGFKPSFPYLVEIARGPADSYLLTRVLAGMVRLAGEYPDLVEPTTTCLRDLCASLHLPLEVRRSAYLDARFLAGQLTTREYAEAVLAPSEDPDLHWFESRLADLARA